MQLPIPIITNSGGKFDKVEITKPKSSVIADTRKVLSDTNDVFQSIKVFLGGCIESVSNDEKDITDKVNIKSMVNFIPYRSAELCLYKILILYDPDKDAVEGVYTCPRCGYKLITECIDNEDIQIDTRDYISSLDISYMETYENILLDLTDPVIIKDKVKDEVLESIESMELRHPTIADSIVAEKKHGNDAIRMQFSMYTEALLKINNTEIDKKFKNMWGVYIFDNIKEARVDLGELNRKVTQYGLDPNLKKTCKDCGKEFKVPINMSNFFVSALTL